MTAVETFTFSVRPSDVDDPAGFDPFLLDVPTLSGRDHAARRAWWTVFHLLGPRGVDPEQFTVETWPGLEPVGPGGIVERVVESAAVDALYVETDAMRRCAEHGVPLADFEDENGVIA